MNEQGGTSKVIGDILDRICPTEKSHKVITKHGKTFCARCGRRGSDLSDKERKECEE